MTGPVNKDYRNLRMSLVTVSYEALNPGSALVDVINVIWMELNGASEYTGSGIDWPHSRNGLRPSSDATFVIIRLAPPKFGPEQSVFWPFSKVKFKKDNLTRPLGTVIVQTHIFCGSKLFGKLGLATNPLDDPLMVTPAPTQATTFSSKKRQFQQMINVTLDKNYGKSNKDKTALKWSLNFVTVNVIQQSNVIHVLCHLNAAIRPIWDFERCWTLLN